MSKWEIKKIAILGLGVFAGRYVWTNFIVKQNGKGFVQVDKSSLGLDDALEILTIVGTQIALAKFV